MHWGALNGDDELLGVLVLYIGMYTDRSFYGEIRHIFVGEEHRRTGVGTALIKEYHNIIKETDIRESFVNVERNDKDAKGT